ncbi:MAG: energy-coupling factor ABC transporter permease [Myxococcales bacterium]|nr:energy-coupling factor ABC transporter permease [Myxococcales bacterium]
MHIEPGIVVGAKLGLGMATGVGALVYTIREVMKEVSLQGPAPIITRSVVTSALVVSFFEVLPHFSAGISEVHFIFGATLLLFFGAAPAAVGLAMGLMIQGVLFAPYDLPQLGMNLSTLLIPLLAVQYLARSCQTKYVNLRYQTVLGMAAAYHAGVVTWVAFWVAYGQGISPTTFAAMLEFGKAYIGLIIIEPVVDLGLLTLAKYLYPDGAPLYLTPRLLGHASA